MALKMVQETEEVNAEHETGTAFLDLLPDTAQKYLGLYNGANPADSKTATLRNMLMVRTNSRRALVSGDGACAGCGEKSVLRSIAAVTEAYMRPVYHAKSDRFVAKAGELEKTGAAKLTAMKESCPEDYARLRQAIAHLVMAWAAKTLRTPRRAVLQRIEAEHGAITDRAVGRGYRRCVTLTGGFQTIKNLPWRRSMDGLPTA